MDKATPTPSPAPTEKIWECKIGGISDTPTPSWADGPMRQAVEAAFEKVTGKTPAFLFSGWGASLTEPERAVVENRLPNRAEVERLAAQAASAPAVRMLTEDEAEGVWGRTGLNRVHYAADVIREFCAVNAGRAMQADGKIGGV